MTKIVNDVSDKHSIHDEDSVTVIHTGSYIRIVLSQKKPCGRSIHRTGADTYIDNEGVEHKYRHSTHRGDNPYVLRKSCQRCRDLVMLNFSTKTRLLLITLTYRFNDANTPMTDFNTVSTDMGKFVKRLKYSYSDTISKYLYVKVPQKNGAWHVHMLLQLRTKWQRIENTAITEIWGKGYTKTEPIEDEGEDDLYRLSYYITYGQMYKIVPDDDADGKGIYLDIDDKIIYAASLYPPHARFYSYSRGLVSPKKMYMSFEEFRKTYTDYNRIEHKAYEVSDGTGFSDTVIQEIYQNISKRGIL